MESFNLLVKETTKQELFDHVCKHLGKQKTRAMNGDECAYRTDELQCAIGACFSDEHYELAMDSSMETSASTIIEKYFNEATHLSDLADGLQMAHDLSETLDKLHERLILVANTHQLDITEIDKIKEWE